MKPRALAVFSAILSISMIHPVWGQSVSFVRPDPNDPVLQQKVRELTPAKIYHIGDRIGTDDGLDGNPGIGTEEKLFYASLTGDIDNRSILNAIYILKKTILKYKTESLNGAHYAEALSRLGNLARQEMHITDDKVKSAIIAAMTDHLIDTNPNAKQLIAALGKERGTEYVEAIAECWYSNTKENQMKVFELGKQIASQLPYPEDTFENFKNSQFIAN